MNSKTADKIKLAGALAAFAVAGLGFVRFYQNMSPAEGKAYFYDLGARQLFTAPHSSVPPIKGISGEEEDGVRAIVVSPTGHCEDPSTRQVVYLETYTPELKRQVESRTGQNPAPVDQATPTIRRGEAHGFILVKRPDEKDWHPMTTPEAQEILKSISLPGPDGKVPVVCVP